MGAETFERIYEELSPVLTSLEAQRLEVAAYGGKVLRNLLLASAAVVALLVTLTLTLGSAVWIAFGLVVWLIIAAMVYEGTAGKRKRAYCSTFKRQVIEKMVAAMEPGLRYSGSDGIAQSLFEGSDLFDHRADRYHAEDGFRGRIGKTDVLFSEVKAEYKRTTTDSKGRSRTTYHTFFDGLFMMADFHKEFRSPLLVLPDVAERSLGLLGKKLQSFRPFSDKQLVYMEDPEFEKHFVVYGPDQVEARYILSTAMLRRILDLKERWGDDVRLIFRESRVILAVSHSENLLEPKLGLTAEDRAQMAQLYEELKSCFDIVEDLGLNTRLWTKT